MTRKVISRSESGGTVVYESTDAERVSRLEKYAREVEITYSEDQLRTIRGGE